jgi:hypothetical protein
MLPQVNQTEARDLECSCEAAPPTDEPCESVATIHCGICSRLQSLELTSDCVRWETIRGMSQGDCYI